MTGSVPTTPGQSLTFQVVGTAATESSYLAIDDLTLSNVEDCRTEPPEGVLSRIRS